MGYKLNRTKIRQALAAYKEAKRQHKAILTDDEIQGHFADEANDKARALISERYPLGDWKTVEGCGFSLIKAMIDGVPQLADVDPWDFWSNIVALKKMVALAEQV